MLIYSTLACFLRREAASTEEYTSGLIFCMRVNVVTAGKAVSDEDLENTISRAQWLSSSQRELTWAAFDIGTHQQRLHHSAADVSAEVLRASTCVLAIVPQTCDLLPVRDQGPRRVQTYLSWSSSVLLKVHGHREESKSQRLPEALESNQVVSFVKSALRERELSGRSA